MYVKNIKWLNEKIETLEKWKDERKHTKQMEEEIKMLSLLLEGKEYTALKYRIVDLIRVSILP